MNLIANNPITTKDIEMAEKIFGKDIGSLKGKTTRRDPIRAVDNTIDIPRELIRSQQDITLCIDAMRVNSLWFLTTISRNLYYRTALFVTKGLNNPNQNTIDTYREAIENVIRVYNRAGMRIARIHADNEFRPMIEYLEEDHHIDLNFANPQDHVPEAERNNRVIKERTRATYRRIPYNKLPRVMVKALVQEQAKKLNFFPARHGVSRYYSPRMILHQRTLEFNKHCRYALGSYVQVANDPNPTNTNAPRSLDCIYLRYTDNNQGGHEVLHLPTNRTLIRSRILGVIPITPQVIQQVHAMATTQEMPEGLKVKNKYGVTLYDSAWIAGVDYAVSSDDDSDYEDYYSSEESDSSNDNDGDDFDELDEEYEEIYEEEELEDPLYEQQEWNNNNNNNNEDEEDANPITVEQTEAIPDANGPGDNENQTQNEEQQQNQAEQQDQQQQKREEPRVTRSGRISKLPYWHDDYQMHLQTQAHPKLMTREYDVEIGRVIAKMFATFDAMAMKTPSKKRTNKHKTRRRTASQHVQTYSLKAGLKKFQESGKKATMGEMKQLEDRMVFYPIRVSQLTALERSRAMESLMFLVEKRDGRIKARFCANGSTQREYMEREDSASPTVMTDSILITAVIDAKQQRDVMPCDIPNAFVQTDMPEAKKGERVTMKIRGALVDILLEMDYEKYGEFVTIEGKTKVLYVIMSKALYGMLESALLYYKKFRKDMESIGYEINPYDPCVANKMIRGKQHTVCWHVDDLKSSHVDPKVNDEFLKWLNIKYGDVIPVKATRGKRHDYLAMFLNFNQDATVTVDMCYYVKKMVEEFPEKLNDEVTCPWTERLFKVDPNAKLLDEDRAKTFYTFVMKGMFLCKRARQDIHPAIAFLSTRVREPTQQDYTKLKRMMAFLKNTQDEVLTLGANDTQSTEWWVDAAFAVHPDYKSHTGAIFSLGRGAIVSVSSKQKVNSRSSTEAEMIGIDDIVSKALWTRRFIEYQGFDLESNMVYRDNTSAMKLEENGRWSASKRTRHFDIKYFYVTDLIQRTEMSIKYCHTSNMWADYHTKPLTGPAFVKMRNVIMGKTSTTP